MSRGWSKPRLACSRREECSFLRDQATKPMSFPTARIAASAAFNRGHHMNQAAGREAPEPTKEPMKISPTTMLVPKAMTNQGMT